MKVKAAACRGLEGTGGRSSKHRSLISSISRGKKKIIKEISISLWLFPSRHPAFLQDWSEGWDCPALSTSILLLLAIYPHRIQRNKEKSYFGECQGWFFNLIPWREDFVKLICHKELRTLDKTTAIFPPNSPFLRLKFWGQFCKLFEWCGHHPRCTSTEP